ncbi:unnamed protein product [Vicia faba]|uniref:LOB domain-containing protein n=1 Tax=Vicia faba TaxID=3906 RepID=A0AAV1AGW2_VICFA|nr:unnamed protein product [Vicia faba]
MEPGNRGANVCLVCRRLRRRCSDDCEIGQYFPSNRSDDFHSAVSLFGLTNLRRIMGSVEEHQRQTLANSILLEGKAWRLYPGRGLLGYELELDAQISSNLSEVETAERFLAYFKDQTNPNNERGESSNDAFKRNEVVEEKELKKDEKGKQAIIE